MATDLIPFGNLKEAGFEELSGASPHAFNVIVDARATMRRRPGIVAYNTAYSGIIDAGGITGVHATTGEKIFAVGAATGDTYASSIYAVSDTAAVNISSNTSQKLYGQGRPVFAETEALLCVTQGNEIKRIQTTDPSFPIATLGVPPGADLDPSGSVESHFISGVTYASIYQFPPTLDAASGTSQLPPFCSHIAVNSSRILGNDTLIDKTKIRFSDISIGTTDFSGHDTWTPGPNTAGFFTAEANADPVVAVFENTNEVFTFGERVLQVFGPDPNLVFATVSAIELGCCAPYSVVKRNQSFWWLDTRRRFVFSDGRAFDESIGNPIKPVVDSFSRVDDCYGFSVIEGAVDAIVWVFPTAGRALCYQPGVGWGEWASWSESANRWAPLSITAHHLNVNDAVNVVGTSDGRIGRLSRNASTDLGVRMKAFIETGFLDRGTSSKKRTRAVRLTLRRGETASTSSTGPMGYLSWRDSLGPWESPLEVALGRSGDFQTVVTFYSLGGTYRTRQWRFEFDGDDELVLVKVEEDFDVLGQPPE